MGCAGGFRFLTALVSFGSLASPSRATEAGRPPRLVDFAYGSGDEDHRQQQPAAFAPLRQLESEACITTGTAGDGEGHTCALPFVYDGVEYQGCTKKDHHRLWCATIVDDEKSYVEGKWAHCPESAACLVQENSTKNWSGRGRGFRDPNAGAAVASAAVATADGSNATASPSEPYDCDAGYAMWKLGWSDSKKEWCCGHKMKGCSFNCSAGLENWEAGWSGLKKKWCCQTEGIKCPGACDNMCDFNGTKQKCGDLVQQVANTDFAAEPDTACTDAYGQVQAKCSVCSGCTLADAACAQPGTPAAGGPGESAGGGTPSACDTNCTFKNLSVSCRERVQWSAENQFYMDTTTACPKAHERVLSECGDQCESCTLVDASCKPPPPAPAPSTTAPGSLTAPPPQPDQPPKNESAGTAAPSPSDCPEPHALPTGPEPGATDDLDLSRLSCDTLCRWRNQTESCRDRVQWSASNQYPLCPETACAQAFKRVKIECGDACSKCSLEEVKCVPPTVDCSDGNQSTWPDQKKVYCCDTQGIDCADVALNRTGGGDDTAGGTATSSLYDCAAGFANREKGWSAAKKIWCCLNKNVSCAPEHDCAAGGGELGVDGWSNEKKSWCCDRKGVGCTNETASSDPYDCSVGTQSSWSAGKKVWCCINKALGCGATTVPPSKFSVFQRGDGQVRLASDAFSASFFSFLACLGIGFMAAVCVSRRNLRRRLGAADLYRQLELRATEALQLPE